MDRLSVTRCAISLSLVLGVSFAGGLQLFAAEEDPRFEKARALFDKGLKDLEANRLSESAAEFEESLALRESLPALFNLGLVYERIGKNDLSHERMSKFLALAEEKKETRGVDTARELLNRVRKTLHLLTVVITGDAEETTVDGRVVARGNGELQIAVLPGARRVEAKRTGYRPVQIEVTATAGGASTARLDASSSPLEATLVIKTDAPGVEIRVDGMTVGLGQYQGKVKPGEHLVQVGAPGFRQETRVVRLPPGGKSRVELFLERERKDLTEEWWFWTAVGLAAAGAIVGIAVVASSGEPDYDGGTTGRVFVGLGRGL